MQVRTPAVAGMFYPKTSQELKSSIRNCFLHNFGPGKLPPSPDDKKIIGVICPHAGYEYSGPIAANSYYAISSQRPELVIIIGPNHWGIGLDVATMKEGVWRTPLGDIEVDLMMGKDHKGALLVTTDRSSLFTRLVKLDSKSSKEVYKALIKRFAKIKYPLHTLTFDNDKAFSEHTTVGDKLSVDTFFTRPYTSQDKGTVENRIGVIRRFIPKKTFPSSALPAMRISSI